MAWEGTFRTTDCRIGSAPTQRCIAPENVRARRLVWQRGYPSATLYTQSRLPISVEFSDCLVADEAQMQAPVVRCDSNAPRASSMIRRIVRAQRPHSALHPK